MTHEEKLRAWWCFRQALDGRLAGKSAAETLESTGWARSVGGVNPYLTLFSRAGIRRQEAEQAQARLEIHELPAARGCTYFVPAADFALALKVGQGFSEESEMKTARNLGVTDAEIERLCGAVLKAVSGGELEPEEIRQAVGGAARKLGEEGKKKGLTNTLSVALGKLQAAGEIRRVAANGRFDQQRYRYALWRPNPLSRFTLSRDEAFVELAKKYFSWTGPATIAQFQWFSGLGVKAAKAAVEPLKLVPLPERDDHWIFPEHLSELQEFKPSGRPQFAVVSSLDGLAHLRRNLRDIVAPEDRKRKVLAEGKLCEGAGLTDLHDHAIVDRGRLAGLWEYEVETQSIAWVSFVGKDKDLEKAVQRTQEFISSDLGDARSFSLDSPKSRAPRIEALRSAARVS